MAWPYCTGKHVPGRYAIICSAEGISFQSGLLDVIGIDGEIGVIGVAVFVVAVVNAVVNPGAEDANADDD